MSSLPRIVSLFSGAGGLDLGFSQADFDIAFAVDRMVAAIQTHKRNFPETKSVVADMTVRNPSSGTLAVLDEIATALTDGESIGIIGGPPCQGFSRANPNSRADDPRNQMPSFYLEIVEALQARYDLDTALVDDLVLGCVQPRQEQGGDIARTAVLMAGWESRVPGLQVNRYCASAIESTALAAQKVMSGWESLVVAGGVESMSRVQMGGAPGPAPSSARTRSGSRRRVERSGSWGRRRTPSRRPEKPDTRGWRCDHVP